MSRFDPTAMREDETLVCLCPDAFRANAVPVPYCPRHGDGECGCCEIQDYAEPEDDETTACENCGHSPEEHEPERAS